MKTYAALFVLAFLASYLSTPLLRWLALRWGLLDSSITAGPHQRRSIPRLGGVVVYLALLVALAALFIPNNMVTEEFRQELPDLALLAGPATLLLLLGVVDDLRGMNAWTKLSVQLLAALWLVSNGVLILRLSTPWGQPFELGLLSFPVTLLWLVGITNAFNLIDGLDGLAAGVAFLSASAIAITAALVANTIVVILAISLAGALLGFLRHNFNPAKILLGDSGSLFVGFLLAAAAVMWNQKATTAIAVAAPLVAFAVPVTDTAVSMARRFLRGQPIFASDRQHIHHRLLTLGFTPRQAVLILYAVSALAAFGCILIAQGHNALSALVLAFFVGACWFGLRRLNYPEFAEFRRGFSRDRMAARGRLEEKGEILRAAQTPAEFWQALEAAAQALDLDRVELHLAPGRAEQLRLPATQWAAPDGRGSTHDSLWRLTVPLDRQNWFVLGRSPREAAAPLPLEDVAQEMRSVVAEALARLEPLVRPPAASGVELSPEATPAEKSRV
ncbi:MAG: undecaprenyl/decaprenyl-phosphate alpha-N-acetylglucosaminyl 1-phosphate transferase [Acidobacteria bacterium]|nr:undecaprenyl/decaprenyl-phosphate alpha-N-acetylglucosaminyl 1-phosphate transferase [Acidobacteriota bacterium]